MTASVFNNNTSLYPSDINNALQEFLSDFRDFFRISEIFFGFSDFDWISWISWIFYGFSRIANPRNPPFPPCLSICLVGKKTLSEPLSLVKISARSADE